MSAAKSGLRRTGLPDTAVALTILGRQIIMQSRSGANSRRPSPEHWKRLWRATT
jgi:hypothetical protein